MSSLFSIFGLFRTKTVAKSATKAKNKAKSRVRSRSMARFIQAEDGTLTRLGPGRPRKGLTIVTRSIKGGPVDTGPVSSGTPT